MRCLLGTPRRDFAVWNGGIASRWTSGWAGLYLFSRSRFDCPVDFLNIAAPSVMICSKRVLAVGAGNQAFRAIVKNLGGHATFIRNQMFIGGHCRQPTASYMNTYLELAWFVLVFTCSLSKLWKGEITAFYLIWYGFGQWLLKECGQITDVLGVEFHNGFPWSHTTWNQHHDLSTRKKNAPFYRTEMNWGEKKCLLVPMGF